MIYFASYSLFLIIGTVLLGRNSAAVGTLFLIVHGVFPVIYFASLRKWSWNTAEDVAKKFSALMLKLVTPETYLRPTVTVIIPSHNCVEYLREAVESALDSVGVRVTVLIIDDQSKDGSLELANKLAEEDSRVHVIKNLKSRGAYFCRNVGLQLADTEFIAFLDSDDWQHRDRLRRQIAPILRNKQIAATYSLTQRWSTDLSTPVLEKLQVCHISLVFRTSLIKSVGYFDTVRYSADGEFRSRLISIFGSENVPTLNFNLYKARYREDSLTSSGEGQHFSLVDDEIIYAKNEKREQYSNSFAFWHSVEKAPYVPFPLMKRLFSLKVDDHNNSPFLGESIIGFMAHHPNNFKSFNTSVKSITAQVDELHIFMSNEVAEVDKTFPNNVYVHSLEHGTVSAGSEQQFVNRSGYTLFFDSSLKYPSDYVARMLTEIELHDRKAVVGTKALILPRKKNINRPQKPTVVIEEFGQSKGEWVDLLASGTIGFHTQTLGITREDLINTSTDEFGLATRASFLGIPLLSISRPKNWIRRTSSLVGDSIEKLKTLRVSNSWTHALQNSLRDHPRNAFEEESKS